MSFASNIKKELSELKSFNKEELIKAELLGYMISGNIIINDKKIIFSTVSQYNINRFSKLLYKLKIEDYDICINGNKYTITLNSNSIEINDKIDFSQINTEFQRALIRGVYLGSGWMSNPNSKYHIELTVNKKEYQIYLENILLKNGIEPKRLERENKYSLYLKEADQISKLLAFMGASKSVIKFEEIRVMKDMSNNVNRKVNCETANLNKTINAAIVQIEAIKRIKKNNKFKDLPTNLKEVAILRQEHPEASLAELGQMLKIPIGKSGVNHRLKKIEKIASEI